MSAAAPARATERFRRPSKVAEAGSDFFNAIVYGRPGSGKTTFAATGPTPILFLDCDQGLLSLRNPRPEIVKELDLKLDEIYFEPVQRIEDVYTLIRRIDQETTAQPGYWGTVVLDNLTELQRVFITDLLRKADRALPKIQDWGMVLLEMEKVVRMLRNLSVNTVFIAHERETEFGIGPALSGRIEEELPGYVDLMARLTCVENEVDVGGKKVLQVKRKLRCRELISQKVSAKSRSSRLGDWEEANLSKLIMKSQGG